MEEVAHKNKFTNYSMCIRDAVETFTKELINCLFDTNYEQENGVQTKQ
jgi:serine O-acetyltransferase